ncbi:MAG: hypothetical protein H0U28_06375 [Nocardioidaceae bacterium]|nr:hypothetical protein [Nocardioidaceae bacterium]
MDEKFIRSVAPRTGEPRARRMLGLLSDAERCHLPELLAEVYAPGMDSSPPLTRRAR